jgi:hypothetical protein
MIAVAGSNDPVSVSINRLSGRFLNRCGQKPHRLFCGTSCLPFGWDIYAKEGLNYGLRKTHRKPPSCCAHLGYTLW